MGPEHHAKFQKKLISQFGENLWPDRRMDRGIEGQIER